MDGYLRQSTASQARLIGPFVDDTDFKTEETGLSIANTDVKLRANGTTLSNKNSGGGTHQVNGMYSLTWDATDTANVGELKYSVKVAGALQVFGSYVVLEEAVYDALFAASAPGYVANAPVTLADGVAHGGTLGSSTATLALSRLNVVSQSANTDAVLLTGNGSGDGLHSGGGATGNGIHASGGGTSGDAIVANAQGGNGSGFVGIGNGTGVGIYGGGGATGAGIYGQGGATSGAGAVFEALAGNSDGATFTKAGSGADLNADITGNITGNLSGSAGSVTTVGDKTGYALTAAYDAAKTAAQAGDSMDIGSINGVSRAADKLAQSADTIVQGVVDTGATTTSIPTSSLTPAASVTDQFKGLILKFDQGTATAALRGQATDVTGSSAGGTLTVTALTTAPASGDTFTIG